MKKLSLVLVFVLLCAVDAMSAKVEVKEDQFTKAKVVTLDIWHKVIEGQLDNTRILYEKSIKDGKTSQPVAKFEFKIMVSPNISYGGEDLDPFAYVLVDDVSFKVDLAERKNTTQEYITGRGSTNAMGRYSARVYGGHMTYLRANIFFTPEMIEKIKNAKKLLFRVSTNGNPTVMEAKSSQLKLVKEFFSVN